MLPRQEALRRLVDALGNARRLVDHQQQPLGVVPLKALRAVGGDTYREPVLSDLQARQVRVGEQPLRSGARTSANLGPEQVAHLRERRCRGDDARVRERRQIPQAYASGGRGLAGPVTGPDGRAGMVPDGLDDLPLLRPRGEAQHLLDEPARVLLDARGDRAGLGLSRHRQAGGAPRGRCLQSPSAGPETSAPTHPGSAGRATPRRRANRAWPRPSNGK